MKSNIVALAVVAAFSAAEAFAQFPLPIPARPTSFPLQRPSATRDVIVWTLKSATPTGLSNVVQISSGNNIVALRNDGTVASVDYWSGQTSMHAGLSNIVQVAAGDFHNVALRSDGTVDPWGAWSGQTSVPPGLSNVVQVAAGNDFSLALRSDGTVTAWGANWSSQTSVPPGLSNVVQVTAGGYHSVALKNDGTVVAWGANWSGELPVPPGLSNVVQVAAGDNYTVALKNDGTVVAWGANWSGELPVPPGLSNVVQVAAGYWHNLALKSDGALVAWGENWNGETNVPAGLYDVIQVSAGNYHSAVLGRQPVQIAASPGGAVAWAVDRPFEELLATYGTPPYEWSIVSGTLPAGLTLGSDGFLSGTPTVGGTYRFTARVTDALGSTDSRNLVFRVIPTAAGSGGYAFRNLAGALNGTFTGSSFTGSVDECSGSFTGSADGIGGGAGFEDGNGSSSLFRAPSGIAVDASGNIYVSDSGNHAIRKLSVSGNVTTLAGSFLGSGTDEGLGVNAKFSDPQGLATDSSGNIYVAERDSHRIRKVSPWGEVSHYVGKTGSPGSADGSPAVASFNSPSDVAVDSSGNIYVADAGNHAIRRIAANGTVSTWAGQIGSAGTNDATGVQARFKSPQGVAVDSSGNVYVADTGNSVIRKINPSRVVSTLAGAVFTGSASEHYGRESFTGSACGGFVGSADGNTPESADGTGTAAAFSFPTDVEVDAAGNVYVTDSGTSKIRKIATNGVVTTLGNSPEGFFYHPLDLAINPQGVLFVADTGDNRIAMSFDPLPVVSVETLGGLVLSNSGFSQSIGAVLAQAGTNTASFRIRNIGFAELSGIAFSKTGSHTNDFNLVSLFATNLAAGADATFSVAFVPSAGGNRNAQIRIASNDTNNSPFIINVSGFGISTDFDTDSDGLNDAAEYRMSTLGFDWQLPQQNLVAILTNNLAYAGFYNSSQIHAMNVGTPLISKNPATGQFELTVGLQKSTNLQTFLPFSLLDTTTTIEADGKLKIRFNTPDRAGFFRLQAK